MKHSMICTACGTQYQHGSVEICPICADDRQYIPEGGQTWTTQEELMQDRRVRILPLQENLYELQVTPVFAIGQRALLVLSPQGNILWDCIPLLDGPTVDFINSRGGLKAIAFSHPHYYSNMNDWAETFECPIYIHHSDEQWIMDKGRRVIGWEGLERPLWDGIRIINIGGHFPGSSILHVPALSPEGAICSGDTLYLAPGKKHIAIQYSYPNKIPLPHAEIERIKERFDTISFDALYGIYSDQVLLQDVKEILNKSLERYLQ
jgi:hypothetical protein